MPKPKDALNWIDVPLFAGLIFVATFFQDQLSSAKLFHYAHPDFNPSGLLFFISHLDKAHLFKNVESICDSAVLLIIGRFLLGYRKDAQYLLGGIVCSLVITGIIFGATPLAGIEGVQGMSIITYGVVFYSFCVVLAGFLKWLIPNVLPRSEWIFLVAPLFCTVLWGYYFYDLEWGPQARRGDRWTEVSGIGHTIGFLSCQIAFLLYSYRELKRQNVVPVWINPPIWLAPRIKGSVAGGGEMTPSRN
ncbi:hypothetical protein [Pelagibius sp. Alg239-R121]|uniref:hypothetical protein n=1 Tax=Pelagibius sp. Alg239-R121 TaxID=2993448 RepID=UPI0024A676E3|nr:hypothetical protein [Pelagibius sp. Alg239-R121]